MPISLKVFQAILNPFYDRLQKG